MSEVKQTNEGTPAALKASNTTTSLAGNNISKEAFDSEMARLELESRVLENKLKKLQLADLEDQVNDRSAKREDKGERARRNGQTLSQLAHNDLLVQKRCNHKKGGNGAYGVVAGQGDDNQYCVLKHTYANGDMWVSCLRCHKTWKPPIREDHKNEESYQLAIFEWEQAKAFQTRNVSSGSVAFRWGNGDNGEFYRKTVRSSTLR